MSKGEGLHLRASSMLASGWKRKPPLNGPRELSCCTRYALKVPISPLLHGKQRQVNMTCNTLWHIVLLSHVQMSKVL